MGAEYFTETLATNTDYKLIKNAAKDGTLTILLFARDKRYMIPQCPNERVKEFVIKEMSRLIPGSTEI